MTKLIDVTIDMGRTIMTQVLQEGIDVLYVLVYMNKSVS